MKNALPMTLLIIALLFGSMALGKLLLNPETPISTQDFAQKTSQKDAMPEEGIAAPDFSALQFHPQKTPLSLSGFQGKHTLLNFWASWCTPCISEMPHLFNLAKDNPDTLALLTLSIDTKHEKAETFFASLIQRFIASDAKNIYAAWDERAQISQNLYGTFQVPESYLISPDGMLIKKFSGVIEEEELTEINALIAQ